MKRKITAIFTVLSIAMTMLPVFAVSAAEDITISTATELKAFRDMVNSGENYSGQTVRLTADIDLEGEEWTPIGRANTDYNDGGSFVLR